MLNKRLCEPLAALWLGEGGLSQAGGDSPGRLLHLIPPLTGLGAFPTHPHTRWQPACLPGREVAGCAATHRKTQASPAGPELPCRSSGGGTRPTQPFTVAQPAGARVPSPGSALRQGRPRLQPPGLCALGSAFPVSSSHPAQLFPTARPGAGVHRCRGRRRVYASDQCMHPRLLPWPRLWGSA